MSAQRYTNSIALERMEQGNCPECGLLPKQHSSDPRFWVPRNCDLRIDGVQDRIDQFIDDILQEELDKAEDA